MIPAKQFANTLTTNFTYSSTDFRLNRIQTGTVQDVSYTYDNIGNVASTTAVCQVLWKSSGPG
jgi:hypothetical protein